MLKIKPVLEWNIITGTRGTSGECLLSSPAGEPGLVALACCLLHKGLKSWPFGTKISPLMFEQKEFSKAGTKALSHHILALVREYSTGPSGPRYSWMGERKEKRRSGGVGRGDWMEFASGPYSQNNGARIME